MSFPGLFVLIFLSAATSALGHFPLGYPGFQPHLVPGSGVDGFSYFKGLGGVKFFAGSNSWRNLNDEEATKPDDGKAETSTVASADSKDPQVPPEPEKKVEAITETANIKDVDSKDPEVVVALLNGHLLAGSGFGAPYPVIRFGGSASYYPDLSTPFSGFSGYSGYPGYEPSDYFRSQFEPLDYFGSYQPDDYNPTFPFFYQHPVPTASVESNSVTVKTTTVAPQVPNFDTRIKSDKTPAEKSESSSSTTEQIATTSDSKETTTSVADSAAVA